jgi:hypothetical protein
MIVPADPRPATPPAPAVTVRGGRLPLSPQAITAAARLVAGVIRQRKQRRVEPLDDLEAIPAGSGVSGDRK